MNLALGPTLPESPAPSWRLHALPDSSLGQLGWDQEPPRQARAELAELKLARAAAARDTQLLLGRVGIVTLASQSEDRQLAQATMRLSEASLERVWDNPDDAAYDEL